MPDFRSDAITVEGGLTRLVGHCQGAFRSDGGPCLCEGNNDACDAGMPDCLDVEFSGIGTVLSCPFTCVDGRVVVATASAWVLNRRFRATLAGGDMYTALVPVAFVVDDGGCAPGSVYGRQAELTIFVTCVDDRIKLTRVSLRLLNDSPDPQGLFIGLDAFFFTDPTASTGVGQGIANQGLHGCLPGQPGRVEYWPFGGGSAVVSVPDNCPPLLSHALARHCTEQLPDIVVDLDTIPRGMAVRTLVYEGERYYLSGAMAYDSEAVEVVWSTQACQDDIEYWIAVRCGNFAAEISVDLAGAPDGSITAVWENKRYLITDRRTTNLPVPVTFSREPCPPANLCDGLVPNDIRCNDPLYRNCPQCAGFDIGDPDPRPTNQGQGGGGDPRVAAQLARQQQAYTGQYPGRCPSCGG